MRRDRGRCPSPAYPCRVGRPQSTSPRHRTRPPGPQQGPGPPADPGHGQFLPGQGPCAGGVVRGTPTPVCGPRLLPTSGHCQSPSLKAAACPGMRALTTWGLASESLPTVLWLRDPATARPERRGPGPGWLQPAPRAVAWRGCQAPHTIPPCLLHLAAPLEAFMSAPPPCPRRPLAAAPPGGPAGQENRNEGGGREAEGERDQGAGRRGRVLPKPHPSPALAAPHWPHRGPPPARRAWRAPRGAGGGGPGW